MNQNEGKETTGLGVLSVFGVFGLTKGWESGGEGESSNMLL